MFTRNNLSLKIYCENVERHSISVVAMNFVASTYYSDIFKGGLLVLLLIVYFLLLLLLLLLLPLVGSLLFIVNFLSFSLDYLFILFIYLFLSFLIFSKRFKLIYAIDYTLPTAYMLSLVRWLSHQHHFDKKLIASTHMSFVTLFQFFFFLVI